MVPRVVIFKATYFLKTSTHNYYVFKQIKDMYLVVVYFRVIKFTFANQAALNVPILYPSLFHL